MPATNSAAYSYLTLEVRLADGSAGSTWGITASLRHPVRPVGLFLNAPEIYGLCTGRDASVRQVTLWSESGVSASAAVEAGADIDAACLVRLLRMACAGPAEGAGQLLERSGLAAEVTAAHPAVAPSQGGEAVERYMSTGELASLIAMHVSGTTSLPELTLLVEATAVATSRGAKLPELSLGAEAQPHFDVIAPARPRPEGSAATPQNNRVKEQPRTLQEIEDEIDADEPAGAPLRPRPRRTAVWVWVVLTVVALGCGWAAVRYLPALVPDSAPYDGMDNADVSLLEAEPLYPEAYTDTTATAVTDSLAVTPTATDTATTAPDASATPEVADPQTTAATIDAAALEGADREYLNSHTTWRRGELRSEQGRALFDSFAAADIDAIVRQPYFATPEAASNRTAQRVANMLWRAHGSDTEPQNEAILRRLKGKSEINLTTLLDELAKKQSPKPNLKPRPTI